MGDLFEATGALAGSYRQISWAATPLGAESSWSLALRAAVRLIGQSRAAMTLIWGPQHVLLYNQAYAEIIADKHPEALGRPTQQVFPEIWADIEPLLQHVHAGHEASWLENSRLPLYRNGKLQERHFTYSYSAITNEHGAIEGVLDVVTETTAEVIANRRLTLLAQLADQLNAAKHPHRVQTVALELLRQANDDLTHVTLEVVETAADEHTRTLTPAQSQNLQIAAQDDHLTVTARLTADHGLAHGLLTGHIHPQVVDDDAFREFLRLVSAALVQALNRVTAQQVERRNTGQERAMSQALQRSLLTEPAHPDHLQVAVRYQPAAARVFVGGDWHDSFLLPDGRLTVVDAARNPPPPVPPPAQGPKR